MAKKYMGKYTKKQIGLIVSFILGDGYITKNKGNSQFGCQHSKKQIEWIQYKMKLLSNLGFNVTKLYDVSNKYGELVRFYSNDPVLFNQLRSCFYPKNNKTIKRKWLNYMSSSDLANWFMDDGSFTYNSKRSGYISLHTNSYNKKEHDIIIKYFKQVWGVAPTLRVAKRKNRKQSYFLTFKLEETKKLIKILQPHIINSMLYKVGFIGKEQPILG
jgi:hypothetical protein